MCRVFRCFTSMRMSWGTISMSWLYALLLVVVLLSLWLLTFLGMPGNWFMLMAIALYVYLIPAESSAAFGWNVFILLVALAGLGELVELLAGSMGAAKAGGSRRGAVLALVGSLIGGMAGIFLGLPIPLFGSLLAALLFAGLGAMAGAILGELWTGRKFDASWGIGKAAFWGRLAGTLGKALVGATMIAVVLAALVL
jgi:uncharacterized protein